MYKAIVDIIFRQRCTIAPLTVYTCRTRGRSGLSLNRCGRDRVPGVCARLVVAIRYSRG